MNVTHATPLSALPPLSARKALLKNLTPRSGEQPTVGWLLEQTQGELMRTPGLGAQTYRDIISHLKDDVGLDVGHHRVAELERDRIARTGAALRRMHADGQANAIRALPICELPLTNHTVGRLTERGTRTNFATVAELLAVSPDDLRARGHRYELIKQVVDVLGPLGLGYATVGPEYTHTWTASEDAMLNAHLQALSRKLPQISEAAIARRMMHLARSRAHAPA